MPDGARMRLCGVEHFLQLHMIGPVIASMRDSISSTRQRPVIDGHGGAHQAPHDAEAAVGAAGSAADHGARAPPAAWDRSHAHGGWGRHSCAETRPAASRRHGAAPPRTAHRRRHPPPAATRSNGAAIGEILGVVGAAMGRIEDDRRGVRSTRLRQRMLRRQYAGNHQRHTITPCLSERPPDPGINPALGHISHQRRFPGALETTAKTATVSVAPQAWKWSEKLVAFDTTSRNSNLELIGIRPRPIWPSIGVECHLVHDAERQEGQPLCHARARTTSRASRSPAIPTWCRSTARTGTAIPGK